jgi:hypothetical protein
VALPLRASQKICAALERLERVVDGRTLSAPVPQGKHEIPRGTLRSILRLLDFTEGQFHDALRSIDALLTTR